VNSKIGGGSFDMTCPTFRPGNLEYTSVLVKVVVVVVVVAVGFVVAVVVAHTVVGQPYPYIVLL
jgi:hypothetical protein